MSNNKLLKINPNVGRGRNAKRFSPWVSVSSYFDFKDFDEVDKTLQYNPREWFYEAVEAQKRTDFKSIIDNRIYNYYTFKKKDNFSNSDWVKFMRAAAEHKYKVIHNILPSHDVYVG